MTIATLLVRTDRRESSHVGGRELARQIGDGPRRRATAISSKNRPSGGGIDPARTRTAPMSPDRSAQRVPTAGEMQVDPRPTNRPPAVRPSGMRRKAPPFTSLDPLEEALLSRPLWDSREPEPTVHEVLYRFMMGDQVGAIAAADLLLDGRRVPALTVSIDVLDEIDLDYRAALVLAHVDNATSLSGVLASSGLTHGEALRTVCELVERRIVVLRPPR
jgi:hypothetical protein